MPSTTFDAVEKRLTDLMREIAEGRAQLPEFQRDWKWTDEQIASLIASVTQSFPIHSILTLEAGGAGTEFKSRLFSGAPQTGNPDPEILVLDGQQRLTSLFQAIASENAVETLDARGNPVKRHYYLDMARCADPNIDREEAVISIPDDRLKREQEFERSLFPVSETHRSDDWLLDYMEHWKGADDKRQLYRQFKDSALDHLRMYNVPVIQLGKQTPIEAICNIFIKVNTSGIQLNEFELLTAKFAAHGVDLRADWAARVEQLGTEDDVGDKREPVLSRVREMDFIRAVTLVTTTSRGNPGVRPRDVLRLTVDDYRDWADVVTSAFRKTAGILHELKVFEARDVPYGSQVTALAAVLCLVQEKQKDWETVESRERLARWFWNGVFGEMYAGTVEGLLRRDCAQVPAWLLGADDVPETVADASFAASRLRGLRTRQSAAYKGIYALLMRSGSGALDFVTGKPTEEQQFADEQIEIHHVFPKKWCIDHGYTKEDFDSIINRTPLSLRANRLIGKRAPSDYLPLVQREAEVDKGRLDEIVRTHLIDPDLLAQDSFRSFYLARGKALTGAIEAAMGKPVVRSDTDFNIP